jgi:DNA replication protein DnaC
MRKEQVKKNPRDASMTPKQDDNNTPKSLELSEGQLEVHFRRLNLAHTRRIYKEVAVRAEKESWSYRDFLALLLAEEVARRKQTRLQRCTRSAHFPFFKTIDEFDFTLQSTLRESVIGSYLGLDFVTEGRSLILHGKTGRGKTHLAVAIGYRAIQNGFEALFTTAAELIEDLSNASKRGNLHESLTTYTRPHVLVIDEVGYLTYGPDAANVLFHVVNDRHLRKRPMIFTTNKPLNGRNNNSPGTRFVRERRSVREFSGKQIKKLKKTLDTAGVVRDGRLSPSSGHRLPRKPMEFPVPPSRLRDS